MCIDTSTSSASESEVGCPGMCVYTPMCNEHVYVSVCACICVRVFRIPRSTANPPLAGNDTSDADVTSFPCEGRARWFSRVGNCPTPAVTCDTTSFAGRPQVCRAEQRNTYAAQHKSLQHPRVQPGANTRTRNTPKNPNTGFGTYTPTFVPLT